MSPRVERSLRWFLGLSLILGGLVLLAGGFAYGTLAGASPAVVGLAAAVAVLMSLLTAAVERRPWPAMAPAAGWIGSVMLAILWAHFDSLGHTFLSGYAALVAFATGIGILGRRVWAWPVALASVAGFGPTVLVLAGLPTATIAAGFALFLVDVVVLLALAREFFQPR